MPDEYEFAHHVAGEVLTRMLADGGPRWTVLEVAAEETTAPPTDPSGVFHLRITLGRRISAADTVAVYFTAGMPREDAVVATAGQVQDHAVEATHGMALPACPGHQHPLQAGVGDGIARWACPRDASHYREPVLRAAAE